VTSLQPAAQECAVMETKKKKTCLTQALRSPSPAPQYDNHGRRINTREYRYRKRLEDERHKLVERAMKTIPNYHPPSDYRRPTKTQEKVYVPVNDYPEINFSTVANPLTSNNSPPFPHHGIKPGTQRHLHPDAVSCWPNLMNSNHSLDLRLYSVY
jgi:hypothetical protein